jgi:hypothetical protein
VRIYADRIRDQYAHVPILTLDELRALPEAEQFDSGIYFLWNGPDLMYIGRSRNILDRQQRLTQAKRCSPLYQASHKAVPHDRHTALVLEKGMFAQPGLDTKLRLYERAYINAYLPPYNIDRASGLT